MGMWTGLAIFTIIVMCVLGYWLTVRVGHKQKDSERDPSVPKVIEEYPFLLNPIVLLYGVFFLVTGIIIFYYWAQAVSS